MTPAATKVLSRCFLDVPLLLSFVENKLSSTQAGHFSIVVGEHSAGMRHSHQVGTFTTYALL
jgi:hypothetical protein